MAIVPLSDRIVIKAKEEMSEKIGSIIIPDTAKEKPAEGTVIAVGPGTVSKDGSKIPLNIDVGDTVIYQQHAGTEITVEGTEYLIMSEREIFAVIED